MTPVVRYELNDAVATITMDDGKVNALSLPMLAELDAALDRAERDGAVVVLTGREGIFSAGFHLPTLRAGGPDAAALLRAGFELAHRLLSFPTPTVIACPGHAIAMGVFLLLSADYRLGVAGDFKITANEVAIGLTVPRAAVEICRQRLTPAAFVRAVLLSEAFDPAAAVSAGFLDRVVSSDSLSSSATGAGVALAKLDMVAHLASKQSVRRDLLPSLWSAIEADDVEFRRR